MLHSENLVEKSTDAVLDWMYLAAAHRSLECYYLSLGVNSSGDRIDISLGYLSAIDEKESTPPEDRAYIWFGDWKDRNIAGLNIGKKGYEIIT